MLKKLLIILGLMLVLSEGVFACGRGGLIEPIVFFIFLGFLISIFSFWINFAFKFENYKFWNFISLFYEISLLLILLPFIGNLPMVITFLIIVFIYWSIVYIFWNFIVSDSIVFREIIFYKMKAFIFLSVLVFIGKGV
jgi:hypothetical protein